MNVFISQPMRGMPERDILAVRQNIAAEVQSKYPDAVIMDTYIDRGAEYIDALKHPRVGYLGQSLTMLADADMIVMAKGWESFPGCRIEHRTATYYDIPIQYEGNIC